MGQVTKEQLKELFTRVDKRLKKKLDVYIIGGASAILGYEVIKETNDVDVDGPIDPDFKAIFEDEADTLGLDLYLSSRGIFSPPDGYRNRCHSEDFPAEKLRVWYLDQYDLAISKLDRGLGKDYEDLQRVHKKKPFSYEQLIEIFNNEYINVSAIGNLREKKMNLVDLILNLFGSEYAEDAKKKVGL
ncbi:MAG: hypothetical protein C5B49_09465 [Bdellovibrio sp.]|nr:MAG: hypothetical protein C5B49_09465 [Bdellovibrio sp.]